MIEKELVFNYNLNFKDIYNLAVENNDEFIKVIPEIVLYDKGVWMKDDIYRKDKLLINIADIPYDLRGVIDMIRDKKGLIGLKIKIKKILNTDKDIHLRIKLKLNGFLGRIIEKFLKIISNINIIYKEDFKTEVKVRYQIKSMFPNDLNDKIDNHIQNKLNNYYIKKIDNYFNNL
jgi:hypothetical protein